MNVTNPEIQELKIVINSPNDEQCKLDKKNKGYVSKFKKYITGWPIIPKRLDINITSIIQEKYTFDVSGKGYVSKKKPYITKWL